MIDTAVYHAQHQVGRPTADVGKLVAQMLHRLLSGEQIQQLAGAVLKEIFEGEVVAHGVRIAGCVGYPKRWNICHAGTLLPASSTGSMGDPGGFPCNQAYRRLGRLLVQPVCSAALKPKILAQIDRAHGLIGDDSGRVTRSDDLARIDDISPVATG